MPFVCRSCCDAGPAPNTTVSGTAFGCSAVGIDADLEIRRTSDNFLLWSGTTATGPYSASIYLAANTNVTLYSFPNAPHDARLNDMSQAHAITAGVANTNKNVAPALDGSSVVAGFHCIGGLGCNAPIPDTMFLRINGGAAITLTFGLLTGIPYWHDVSNNHRLRQVDGHYLNIAGTLDLTAGAVVCPYGTTSFTYTSGPNTFIITEA
jgi:hypothetical protein